MKKRTLNNGQVNHLKTALYQAGWLSAESLASGEIDDDLVEGIKEKFLKSKKGKDAKRVINACRTIKVESFSGIKSINEITPQIRWATEIALETQIMTAKARIKRTLAEKRLAKVIKAEEEVRKKKRAKVKKSKSKIIQTKKPATQRVFKSWQIPNGQKRGPSAQHVV